MNYKEKCESTKKREQFVKSVKQLPKVFREVDSLFTDVDKFHGPIFDEALFLMCDKNFLQTLILSDILSRFRITKIPIKTKNEFDEEIIEFVYAICQTRIAVRMKISIWAKKFDKSEETIRRCVKSLVEKGYVKNIYKGPKKVRYFIPQSEVIREERDKKREELFNHTDRSWVTDLHRSGMTDALVDNSVNFKTRTSSKNSSNSYENSISPKSVKPRLKLRKNKNQGFVSKTKSPAKTKLKLRSAAKKLKDAALYSEPVDLRKEKRKAKPIKQIPRKVQECIDHWNSSGLRKHKINFDNPTKTLQQSIKSLKQLLAGRAFRNGQEQFIEEIDPAYTKKVFSVDDWKQSVSNFAKVVTDPTYQNMCKHYGDKVSIPEFIYRHDWPTVSRPKSHFCYNLKYEPKVVQPTYRMPYLTSAPQKLYDAFLKLLADEYQTPTNTLTEEDKVFLAIFIRDFHQTLLNFYNQNKLDSVFGNLWANGSFGSYGLAEQLMKLLQSEWPGPPMSIPFGFIVNKRRIERLPGTLKKLGWMN